jgi:hypothetical protein
VAEILGDLFAESNQQYTDIIREKFPDAVKRWEQRPGMVIVRIKPTFVVTGGSGDEPALEILDLENETAFAEKWAHY